MPSSGPSRQISQANLYALMMDEAWSLVGTSSDRDWRQPQARHFNPSGEKWFKLDSMLEYMAYIPDRKAPPEGFYFRFLNAPQIIVHFIKRSGVPQFIHECTEGYWNFNDRVLCYECNHKNSLISNLEEWAEGLMDPLTATLWTDQFKTKVQRFQILLPRDSLTPDRIWKNLS